MLQTMARQVTAGVLSFLGALSIGLLTALAPARAGGDVSNFNVRNCTSERIFVCSFDKTDSLMKIPYKARGIQPGDRKEFGCASIGRCKVIIGVSKRKAKQTLSSGMQAAIAAGSVGTAALGAGAGYAGVCALGNYVANADTLAAGLVGTSGIGAAVVAVAVGGAIAGIEISDGWSDGEVCNQVRKAAARAGMKPKDFLQDGKKYTVVPQYATDKNGSAYLNPDGTAVFAYDTKKGDSCPSSLKTQLVPN